MSSSLATASHATDQLGFEQLSVDPLTQDLIDEFHAGRSPRLADGVQHVHDVARAIASQFHRRRVVSHLVLKPTCHRGYDLELSSDFDRGRSLDTNQFGPDAMPISGSCVPALYSTTSSRLDRNRVLRRWLPGPVAPLAYLGGMVDADQLAELRDAGSAFAGEIFVKGHESVARATDYAASNRYSARGYNAPMGLEEIQAHRRRRLQAAVDRLGSKAELGRRLGYQDGSHVGQMLRGEKPITEKTVIALEALPGMAGWFGSEVKAEDWPFPLVSRSKWELLTEQEKGAVQVAINAALDRYQPVDAGQTTAAPKVATLTPKPGGARQVEPYQWKRGKTREKVSKHRGR